MKLSVDQSQLMDELYRKHHQDVFLTALRFGGGDRDWAKDRMQDVFIILMKNLKKLDNPHDAGGWIYRVTVNTCLKHLRRARGWRAIADRLMSMVAGPSALTPQLRLQARCDVSQLEVAIAELPPLQRGAMSLLYFEEKSQSEVAELLGISRGYMSKLHRRALAKLEEREWELHGE